jgi:hypothetical protein
MRVTIMVSGKCPGRNAAGSGVDVRGAEGPPAGLLHVTDHET